MPEERGLRGNGCRDGGECALRCMRRRIIVARRTRDAMRRVHGIWSVVVRGR